MALYVHPENQTLLWETINKSPIVQQVFDRRENEKAEWFRGIVKQVYSSILPTGRVLSRDELQHHNRATIGMLLAGVGGGARVLPGGPPVPINYPVGHPGNSIGGKPVSILKEPLTEFSRNTAKKNEFQEQFSSRQKEYETMFQKPLPKEINFSEQMEDGVITNMEELIQKEKRQREMEISQQFTVGVLPPASPVPPPTDPHAPPANTFVQFASAPAIPPQTHTIPKRLQITEEMVVPSPTEILTPDPLGLPPPAAEITLYDNWRETMMVEMEKMRRQIEVLQETLARVTMKKREDGEEDVEEDVEVAEVRDVAEELVENVIQEIIDKIQKDNL
jgi:hypothetical protein